MKLLSIETCSSRFINGYVELEGEYAAFSIEKGSTAVIHARFPKSNYRSYVHFAGVIGKFNPYAFLLKEPISIAALDFDQLSDLYNATPAFRRFE